jgi:hypothetical protein
MKTILHLCADIGSDSIFYQMDSQYRVIKVGKDIGVENFHNHYNRLGVHGIIANPVCTEFSTASGFDKVGNLEKGMEMVNHCIRIINETKPEWSVIENPFNGRLKELLGRPKAVYQPWEFGSPWTKKTALWGNFVMPKPLYYTWEACPKIDGLYQRPGRSKPGLVYMHKSAVDLIPEFQWARQFIKTDADIRSMCSRGFAKAFYNSNP